MQRSRYTHIAKEYSPTHRSLQPVASSTIIQPIISEQLYLPLVEENLTYHWWRPLVRLEGALGHTGIESTLRRKKALPEEIEERVNLTLLPNPSLEKPNLSLHPQPRRHTVPSET